MSVKGESSTDMLFLLLMKLVQAGQSECKRAVRARLWVVGAHLRRDLVVPGLQNREAWGTPGRAEARKSRSKNNCGSLRCVAG